MTNVADPDACSAARTDLVMQRLSGPTMLQALMDAAITPEQAGGILAHLLRRLHTIPARASTAPGNRILHLDLHPDNVMLTSQGPVVIDWCNTAEGPPGLDWAMSALIHAQVAVTRGARWRHRPTWCSHRCWRISTTP